MFFSLSILDRINLLKILPTENNIMTMKIVKQLKDVLGFNEDDYKKYSIKITEKDGIQTIIWDTTIEKKDLEIGIKGIEIISKALKDLSNNNKLTEQHIELYDMFVGE